MTLRDFFEKLPHGAKTTMASDLKISKTWLSLVISGRKIPSPTLAIAISQYTKGKVAKKSLRPDIFGI
jgi:DNA-binding transcriptional regulator YdaS (Cro superfamily)